MSEQVVDMTAAAVNRVRVRVAEPLELHTGLSGWFRSSTCSRYFVSKALCDGTPMYLAWRSKGNQPPELISERAYLSAAPAEKCCQRHADANP